jgi:hypothetical protein
VNCKDRRATRARPGRKARPACKDPSDRLDLRANPDPLALPAPWAKGEKGDKGDAGSAGIRVLEPVGSGGTASCDSGEVMIGAWCTGTYQSYPLRMGPGANEASCTAAENADVKVVIVCAKQG